jgi:hypothetical protein
VKTRRTRSGAGDAAGSLVVVFLARARRRWHSTSPAYA